MDDYKKLVEIDFQTAGKTDKEVQQYWDDIFTQSCQKRYVKSGIDEYFFDKSFSSIKNISPAQNAIISKCHEFVKRVLSGIPSIILMCGKSGTGKTLLSCCVMRDILMTNKPERYEGNQEFYTGKYCLSEEVKNRFESAKSFTSKENENDITKDYCDPDVLIVDEIGQNTQDREKETFPLFRITNARVYAKKSTIYISNLSHDDIVALVGPATASRLSTSALFLDFDGIPDFRIMSRDNWGSVDKRVNV